MKYTTIILLLSVLILLFGCGMMPAKPADAVPAEDSSVAVTTPTQKTQSATPATTEPAVTTVETTAPAEPESKYVASVSEPVNDTNATKQITFTISGSLKLQKNLALCPHLASQFDCDKNDVRRCEFKTIVGKNDFYPDVMSCRDGYEYKKENPNHKYCFAQECRPIEKLNIVEAYGGPVASAEYIYSESNVDGLVIGHYNLYACGEMREELDTSRDCKFYLSKFTSR